MGLEDCWLTKMDHIGRLPGCLLLSWVRVAVVTKENGDIVKRMVTSRIANPVLLRRPLATSSRPKLRIIRRIQGNIMIRRIGKTLPKRRGELGNVSRREISKNWRRNTRHHQICLSLSGRLMRKVGL